jgi:hypothetical protein
MDVSLIILIIPRYHKIPQLAIQLRLAVEKSVIGLDRQIQPRLV